MVSQRITLETLTQTQAPNEKDLYLLDFFLVYNSFFDTCIANCSNVEDKIDVAVGLILATCPDKTTQDRLLDEYAKYCNDHIYTKPTAAAFSIGSLLSYIDDTMQITDQSEFSEDNGLGGKPKTHYLMEINQLLEKYKNDVISALETSEQKIDAATALIIARYPVKEKREQMWEIYIKNKNASSQYNATIIAAADLFTHMSKEFDLVSESFMGF